MFKRNSLCAGLVAAFGGSAMLGAVPSLAQETEGSRGNLGRVEITGSAIKRVDAEGPLPIEIISREEIERSGATSVNELVRSISAIEIFNQGELTSNSPAGSGTTNIEMRGLDETNVLVLLNGRRLAINAIHDGSGAGSAVDVNMIPIGAIERIEILKDGASAIYGADAVAGVFNIITRKNYTGGEVNLQYGQSSRNDGREKRAGLTFGLGDIDSDRYNLLVTLDYFKRDPIKRSERDISRSVDFRRFGSGDFRSSFSPYGNYQDADGNYTGAQVRPCPAEDFDAAASRCRYDFNASVLDAYNGADRLTGMMIGTLDLTSSIRLNGEFLYSKSEDYFASHPVPDFFLDAGTGQYYAGRFMQGGPRETNRDSNLSHFALGLEGLAADTYDWSFYAGQSTSRVENRDRNYYNADLWAAALEEGLIDATTDTNDPALVESLKVSPTRFGKSQTRFVDAKVSGPITAMPAGDLKFAVGVSFWRETLTDTPDLLSQQGLVIGSIPQSAVSAKRNAKAVFGELQIPVLKDLEAQVALRYDDYQVIGSKTSPKFALRYQPVPQVAFRASYTESFKAPRLKQLYGATEAGAETIRDPGSCQIILGQPNCEINGFVETGSSATLKPEEGKTFNFGIIVEPVTGWSLGADWWRIEKTNEIGTPTTARAIEQGRWRYDTTANPPRYYVSANLQNLAEVETEGIDLDLRGNIRIPSWGTIRVRDSLTYTYKVKEKLDPDSPWDEYAGTYRRPRVRNTFSLAADRGPWTGTMYVTYVSGFYDSDLPLSRGADGAMAERRVESYDEIGVGLSHTGLIKGLTLGGGIHNLFDRMPPFSAENASDNAYSQMGFAELYTNRGRFYYLTAKYEF